MSLAPDTAENLAKFSAALASVASNPTTALTARFLFDRGIVSISARFRATRSLAHACARASIPVRTRYEPGWKLPRPAPPLSRFRVTGRVRTTRAPSVRVVVTRAAFCVYTTKCRRKAASWLLRSMTLRSHFGTCLALAGKCARKRAVPSLSFANKTQPFALARVIIIRVDYQSTRMQETEKISHRLPTACEKSGVLCHQANTSACESPMSNR